METFYRSPQHTCHRQISREQSRSCVAILVLHRSRPAGVQHTRSPGSSSSSHGRRGRPELVQCMAHPRRVARVAKQIEREVGTLLLTDRVLQGAVCPEVRLGLDTNVSAIASVTDVELSRDMQVAKIYISVYSDPQGRHVAMRGLSRLEGYVRKHIASSINMRLCPEIRFIQDDSIQRGEEVMALLERIRRQDAGEIAPPEIAISGASPRGGRDEPGDWDENTAAEGVGAGNPGDLEEDDEGFLEDLEEDPGSSAAQLAEVLPEVAAAERRRADAGEDDDVDEDGSEADESDGEEEDDEDDEVDGDSLRAWGINPDDPLALDFMPSTEGSFAPTVREPWRSARELKRVKGRATKKGRKSSRRR